MVFSVPGLCIALGILGVRISLGAPREQKVLGLPGLAAMLSSLFYC